MAWTLKALLRAFIITNSERKATFGVVKLQIAQKTNSAPPVHGQQLLHVVYCCKVPAAMPGCDSLISFHLRSLVAEPFIL